MFFLFLFFRTGGREASLKGGALLQSTLIPDSSVFSGHWVKWRGRSPFLAAGCRFAAPFHGLFLSREAPLPPNPRGVERGTGVGFLGRGVWTGEYGVQRELDNGTNRKASQQTVGRPIVFGRAVGDVFLSTSRGIPKSKAFCAPHVICVRLI